MRRAAIVLCLTTGCFERVTIPKLVERGEQPKALFFHDVRLFAATGPEAKEHQDVLVEDGRISSIGRPAPAGALIVEGAGKTLMPGLVDMHVHTTVTPAPPWFKALPRPQHNLEAHLFAGVTTVHDCGGAPDEVRKVREKVRSGEWLGPRIIIAGPLHTAPGGYPKSFISRIYSPLLVWFVTRDFIVELDDPKEAYRRVHELDSDFVKVMVAQTPDSAPRISPEVLASIVLAAHEKGKKVVAHVDTAENALLAARAGVDALVHGVHSTPLTAEQALELKASGVSVAPTVVTFQRLIQLADGKCEFNAIELESEAPELLASFTRQQADAFGLDAELMRWIEALGKNRDAQKRDNVRALYDAKVPLLVGSDANGSVGSLPGGIHDEMRLLVEAGVPAAEVLLGATSRAARFVNPDADFGTIEPGRVADLLLVDGNPLQDITATQRISMVIQAGRVVRRLK